MAAWVKRIPFQVDVPGLITLMGTSLYSRFDAPIRELIQNAHDGIMRRRQGDLTHQGRIDIRQDSAQSTIRFQDNGIGLDRAEAEKYLGTLGISLTALIKKGEIVAGGGARDDQLIGQFGIGLFSAFMLADRLVVEAWRVGGDEAIRWEAGSTSDIELRSHDMDAPGTIVTLQLKEEFRFLAEDAEALEAAVREHAEFLTVPIYLNDSKARSNLSNVAWFEPTPDVESVTLELATYFDESPLDLVPIRIEKPTTIFGVLYVTPQRTPGFTDHPTVAVTVRRMVVSRKIQDLLPEWAPFLRGVLELTDCMPTASREDLVRDARFKLVRDTIEELLYKHFESLAQDDPIRLLALINWHRYVLAGAALSSPRLRELLRRVYRFTTSAGQLSFEEILRQSEANPIFESEADRIVWYNPDRRQEQWIDGLFANHRAPCVHALRSFEESLLAAMVDDVTEESIELRVASPSTKGFAAQVLGVREIQRADEEWQDFLGGGETNVFVASFEPTQPVMAFLNERKELLQTFEELKKQGSIPSGFQRMIDAHFRGEIPELNEVLLNREHLLVSRALSRSTAHPLASVLRMLVVGALASAGASVTDSTHRRQRDDLEWIAEVLWNHRK